MTRPHTLQPTLASMTSGGLHSTRLAVSLLPGFLRNPSYQWIGMAGWTISTGLSRIDRSSPICPLACPAIIEVWPRRKNLRARMGQLVSGFWWIVSCVHGRVSGVSSASLLFAGVTTAQTASPRSIGTVTGYRPSAGFEGILSLPFRHCGAIRATTTLAGKRATDWGRCTYQISAKRAETSAGNQAVQNLFLLHKIA